MAEQGKITAQDLITPDVIKEFTELNKELQKSLGIFDNLSKSCIQLADALKFNSNSAEEVSKNSKSVDNNYVQLTKTQREFLKTEQEAQKLAQQKLKTLEAERKAQEAKEKSLKKTNQELAAEANTIEGLIAKNRQLEAAKKKVVLTDADATVKIAAYNAEINKNNQLIASGNSDEQKRIANIGKYKEAVSGAVLSLGDMRKELIALRNTSLTGKTDKEIVEINKRIGELINEMNDAKAMAKNMGEDFGVLATGSLKAFVAGIEGIVGSLNVLGVESKTLEPLQKNITSLIAVTQALAEIQDVLEQKTIQATIAKTKQILTTKAETVANWASAVSSNAKNKATEAGAIVTGKANIATKAAAAGQWLWNAAVLAFPLFWIIAGLAALAGAITLVALETSKETDEVNALKKEYEDLQAGQEDIIKQKEYLMQLNSARGANAVEALQTEINANKELLKNYDGQIKKLEERKEKTKFNAFINKWSNEDESNLQKAYDEYNKLKDDLYILDIKYQNAKEESEAKALEDAEKEYRDALKRKEDTTKKSQENELKYLLLQQEKKNLIERQKLASGAITESQYQQNILNIEIEFLNKRLGLAQTEPIERVKIKQDLLNKEKQINDLKLAEEKRVLDEQFKAFEIASKKEINALTDKYIKDISGTEMTAEKKAEISKTYADNLLNIEIERVQKELDLKNLSVEQTLDLQTQLNDLLKQKQDAITDNKIANDEKEKKSEEDKAKKELELKQQVQDKSIELMNAVFDLGTAMRDAELQQVEEQKEYKLKLAGDDAKQRERIEKEYDRKAAEIKTRQARADKTAALINAAINTALGVTKALGSTAPPANFVLAALVGVLGAIQIATIAAKPIPKFAKGVRNFEGGLAEVGEAGRELIKTPEGHVFITPNQATRMVLPKGADVFTNNETEQILRAGVSAEKFDELIKEQKATRKALSNKIEHHTSLTQSGLEYSQKMGVSKVKFIDTYFRK